MSPAVLHPLPRFPGKITYFEEQPLVALPGACVLDHCGILWYFMALDLL